MRADPVSHSLSNSLSQLSFVDIIINSFLSTSPTSSGRYAGPVWVSRKNIQGRANAAIRQRRPTDRTSFRRNVRTSGKGMKFRSAFCVRCAALCPRAQGGIRLAKRGSRARRVPAWSMWMTRANPYRSEAAKDRSHCSVARAVEGSIQIHVRSHFDPHYSGPTQTHAKAFDGSRRSVAWNSCKHKVNKKEMHIKLLSSTRKIETTDKWRSFSGFIDTCGVNFSR